MSSFSALNVGRQAISAAQRGLDVTGQNISNVQTEGYSRQRVEQTAVGGPGVPAIWSRYDGAAGGVRVDGVSRMRDEFLEARSRSAHAALGDIAEQQKTYEAIERGIGEPSTTGLQSQLGDFWTSWSKISQDERGEGARNVTFQSAQGLANQLNSMSNQLTTQWTDTRTQLEVNVTQVNKLADDVAKLNKAIQNNSVNHLPANELADERDRMIATISGLTGATTEQGPDGTVNVVLGGAKLVDGSSTLHLDVTVAGDKADGTPGTWNERLAAGGGASTVSFTAGTGPVALPVPTAPISLNSGSMKGQLTGLDSTLPSYIAKLDQVAVKLADQVNTQQQAGYTNTGARGQALFVASGGATLTAASITVDSSLKPADLAASSVDPTAGSSDGDNAAKMAAKLGMIGGPDEAFTGLVSGLGVDAASINRNFAVQTSATNTVDDARDSVSGVSLDEEMTNLVQYQHSYAAASKYVSVIDQTLDTLINMVR